MSICKQLLLHFRDYKFNSVFVRNMIIIFLAIACPTVSLYSIMYHFSRKSAMQYAYSSNSELCGTVQNITDAIMGEMATLAINTSIMSEVSRLMLFPGDNKERDAILSRYLKNFLFIYDYLDSMYLFCNENQKVITKDPECMRLSDMEDQDWYPVYQTMQNEELLIYFRKYQNHYPYYLTVIKPVYTTDTDNAGAVVLNINTKRLCGSYKTSGRTGRQQFVLADSGGQIIYYTDEKKIASNMQDYEMTRLFCGIAAGETGKIRQNGENYVVSHLPSKNYDLDYYCAMPLDFYSAGDMNLIITLLVMVGVSLLLGTLISAYISVKVFTPIESIMEILDDPTPWLHVSQRQNKNETDYILQKIVSTQVTNRDLLDERDRRIMLLKRAQTMMLQLQINPHFLGNTLNAISWMAIELTMSDNQVSRAISQLARLFKTGSDTTDYMTSLAAEIDYTKQYIEILNVRYPDIFKTEWIVEPAVQNAKIPKMTLQPLIENAVYYGIKPSGRKGTVTVTARVENGIAELSVSDTGVGMSREKMEALNSELSKEYVYFDGHIGLKNVNQRLKLIYGEAYGLHLEKNSSGGVRAVLHFPYID